MLVSLLAILTAARGLAQTTAESSIQRLPPVSLPPQSPLPPLPPPVAGETLVTDVPPNVPASAATSPITVTPGNPANGVPLKLDGSGKIPPVASLGDFVGYRYESGSLSWIPGNGNQFGMFSIESEHYQPAGINNGLGIGMGFHFLSGPVQTDMPPIVYDFSVGYQIREQLGPLAIDVAASVLEATDFKGNAGQGLQYPAHAVGFLTVGPMIDVVFGVDYLDRGDIKILPVAGLIWKPKPEMRFEMVFPRPRAVFQLTDHYRFYVAGELGGGSWSIERADTFDDDLATYQDLRVCVGVEHAEGDGRWCALEIGYLFHRRLQYTSGFGDMPLDDAVLLRLVTRF
jgi:hypothetical protein